MFHRPRTEDQQDDAAQAPVETVAAAAAPVENKDHKPEVKKMNATERDQDSKPASRPLDIPTPAAGYHPPQHNAAAHLPRTPGSYGTPSYAAAYPGASSALGAGADASKSSAQGRRLVVGEGITLSGEIEACDYVVVEGTVEAALKGASVLEIAESGVFYGTVEIDQATIAGRFEGDITCNGRLVVTSTGSITGSISYRELAIEAGATLDGKVSPLGGKAATTAKKTDKALPKAPARPANQHRNDGSELPFAVGHAAAE